MIWYKCYDIVYYNIGSGYDIIYYNIILYITLCNCMLTIICYAVSGRVGAPRPAAPYTRCALRPMRFKSIVTL